MTLPSLLVAAAMHVTMPVPVAATRSVMAMSVMAVSMMAVSVTVMIVPMTVMTVTMTVMIMSMTVVIMSMTVVPMTMMPMAVPRTMTMIMPRTVTVSVPRTITRSKPPIRPWSRTMTSMAFTWWRYRWTTGIRRAGFGWHTTWWTVRVSPWLRTTTRGILVS